MELQKNYNKDREKISHFFTSKYALLSNETNLNLTNVVLIFLVVIPSFDVVETHLTPPCR